ncbi:MAG: hypothetical protein N3J91_05530 [Verrucomicrobiae bacterium]|nr:hypothetical protein [Verrucomicrobiae bacterium]
MIRWLTRWCFRLLVLALLLLLGVWLMMDSLSKEMTEQRLENWTGLHASIGKMEVGWLRPTLRMENVLLYNSAAYGGTPCLSVPELWVEYDRAALWQRQLRFKVLRLNIAELHVVEGPDGRLNLEAVKQRLAGAAAGGGGLDGRAQKSLEFAGIETLALSLGRLRYSSLRQAETRGYYQLQVEDWVQTQITSTDALLQSLHGLAKAKGLEWLWQRLAKPENPVGRAGNPGSHQP